MSSYNVTKTLQEKVINIYGSPKLICSENATGFTSTNMQQFYDKNNIENITSPPYFPESNGFIERTVATVSSIIKKYVYEHDIQYWSSYLPKAVQAINISKHSSTLRSQFYLLYGYEPRLEEENILGTVNSSTTRTNQIENLQQIREEAHQNLLTAQDYQKRSADIHRQICKLKVGAAVLAQTPVKTNKLTPEYEHQLYEII